MKKLLSLITSLAILTIVVAGCGSKEAEETGPVADPNAAVSDKPATKTGAGGGPLAPPPIEETGK
jgi:predicted small lipoprotein YifL